MAKEKDSEGEKGRQRAQKVGSIKTIGGVLSELQSVYRQARRGEIDTLDASRFASILAEARKILEASDLEQRLKALEEAMNADGV